MRNNCSVSSQFLIDNLEYRIKTIHPTARVTIGVGDPDAKLVIIQPHSKMPQRDSITGALKRFELLDASYRATSLIVEDESIDAQTLHQLNRYYLRELIQLISPLMVVTCGVEPTSMLKGRKIKSFSGHAGKRFQVPDLTTPTFYGTINPMEYGFTRAPKELKERGKQEWDKLVKIYHKLERQHEKTRWN